MVPTFLTVGPLGQVGLLYETQGTPYETQLRYRSAVVRDLR